MHSHPHNTDAGGVTAHVPVRSRTPSDLRVIEDTNGELVASYLMSINPPIAWADVATKEDIAATRGDIARLEANTADVKAASRDDIARLEVTMATKAGIASMATKDDIARVDRDILAVQSRLTTWLLASQAGIATLIGAATTVLIAVLK